MQHPDSAKAVKYSIHNKVPRGKVSIINQTVAAALALFTAGAVNEYILAVLNMIKAEPVWR